MRAFDSATDAVCKRSNEGVVSVGRVKRFYANQMRDNTTVQNAFAGQLRTKEAREREREIEKENKNQHIPSVVMTKWYESIIYSRMRDHNRKHTSHLI